MSTDILAELGPLAFASRLRRLGERLQRDVSRLYAEQNFEFEPRWFPVVWALNRRSPQAVTELAAELGLTHPAINQTAGALSRRGLLAASRDRNDDRRRLLSLTPKGRKLVERLQPVWKAIRDATGDWLDESGIDGLAVLAKLEAELDRRDMYERARNRLDSGGCKSRDNKSQR